MPSIICTNCSAEIDQNAPYCKHCGADNLIQTEKTSYIPNKIPIDDLVRGFMLTPMLIWLAVKFLQDGKAILSFSRNAKQVLEISGPWSSLLGALALLMGAAAFGTMVADHFDKRPNEHLYKKFTNYCFLGFGGFFLLACFVGYQWEHIRWVAV